MRLTCAVGLVALLLLTSVALAADKPKAKGKEAPPASPIERAAGTIFTQSDLNHDKQLSHKEFATTEKKVRASLEKLNKSGSIGGVLVLDEVAAPEGISKSEYVTPEEFTQYFQAKAYDLDHSIRTKPEKQVVAVPVRVGNNGQARANEREADRLARERRELDQRARGLDARAYNQPQQPNYNPAPVRSAPAQPAVRETKRDTPAKKETTKETKKGK